MARVMIAWELGEAFGHFARCFNLARSLQERGHEVTLVFKDLRLPAGIDLAGLRLLQAPITPHRMVQGRPPLNYAGLLLSCGFLDPAALAGRLQAWRTLMELVGAEMVVADHAPSALLAARIAGVPRMAVGNGFTIPPPIHPWPTIRPWEPHGRDALLAAESQLDRSTAEALRRLGITASRYRVRWLFSGRDLLDVFPELDHYERPGEPLYSGPLVALPSLETADWEGRRAHRILAYLRPETPGFPLLLDRLARSGAEVIGVVPGMPEAQRRQFEARGLRLYPRPLNLSRLLQNADVAVGYGGIGFVSQALLCGVPVLVAPRHVEQGLLARRLQAGGLGILLPRQFSAPQVDDGLRTLLDGGAHREAAARFRRKHQAFDGAAARRWVTDLIEARMRGEEIAGREPPPGVLVDAGTDTPVGVRGAPEISETKQCALASTSRNPR